MKKNYSIREILFDLVNIQSDTGTALEAKLGEKLISYFEEDSYFKENPELWGFERENDIFKRPVVWALRKGKSNKTVILSGHYDAVEIDCYGALKPYALYPEILKEKIQVFPNNNKLLQSHAADPDWYFGRGIADMKAGIAIALYILFTYENPDVNILFTAVPDEENISAGTLVSLPLYIELKKRFDLDYKLTVISEPQFDKNEGFTVYNGGTGKILPMIVTKGKVAHCAQPMKGLSSALMMAEIVRNIDLNPDLTTEDSGVSTQVPIVQTMRDLKTTYDVSMPDYTAACVNVLFLKSESPALILERIKDICHSSMVSVMKRYEYSYKYTLSHNLIHPDDKLELNIQIMSLPELEAHIKFIKPDYKAFKTNLEERLAEKIAAREMTLQTASISYIQEMINVSCITEPLVIIGIAPPYYPAVSNNYLNKDLSWLKESISSVLNSYNVPLHFLPYFTAMGDISYMTCADPKQERRLMENLTLPASIYDIPFETIAELDTPCLYLGPRCEDVHQWGERVYMPDVQILVPQILIQIIQDAACK